MAEAVAAFYTVETAVEGAAVGAIAVAKPTVPLHVRLHKLPSPSTSLSRSSHTLTIIKGRAYIFGGDRSDGTTDSKIAVVTLPSDLALDDIDYQTFDPVPAPERPLAPYTDSDRKDTKSLTPPNDIPTPRAAHAAAAVDSDVFIFGGRTLQHNSEKPGAPLDERGTVYKFSAITHQWTSLVPNFTQCSSDVPVPRTYASLTSTPHPLPGKMQNVTTEAHGTLFLHGGYDREGHLLRDVWTFDVSSKVWGRWPDLPPPGLEDVAGEGTIRCCGSRLWRTGDGFGTVAYLDIVRDDADDGSGRSELGVSPKTGQWQVLSFGETAADQAATAQEGKTPTKGPTSRAEELPIPRKGPGLIPVTSGAGREYLLYFLGEDAPQSTVPDIWSFQIQSDKYSPAIIKDKIRKAIGKSSGENQWARCEIVQTTKDEGVLELPQGLSRFASDAWTDLGGGAAVFWGGMTAGGEVKNEGWVISIL